MDCPHVFWINFSCLGISFTITPWIEEFKIFLMVFLALSHLNYLFDGVETKTNNIKIKIYYPFSWYHNNFFVNYVADLFHSMHNYPLIPVNLHLDWINVNQRGMKEHTTPATTNPMIDFYDKLFLCVVPFIMGRRWATTKLRRAKYILRVSRKRRIIPIVLSTMFFTFTNNYCYCWYFYFSIFVNVIFRLISLLIFFD